MRGQGNDLDDQRSSFLSVAQHCAASHCIMSTTGKVLRNITTPRLYVHRATQVPVLVRLVRPSRHLCCPVNIAIRLN